MQTNDHRQPSLESLWRLVEQQRIRIEDLEGQTGRRSRYGWRRVLPGRLGLMVGLVLTLMFGPTMASLAGAASPSASFWGTMGNAISTGQFVGTTNNQDLVVKTNNTEAMRVTTSGNVGIGTSTPGYKLDVNGIVNGTTLSEGGTSLGSKYLKLDGSNAPNAGMPISITGTAAKLGGIAASGFIQGAGHYAVASGVADGSQSGGAQSLLYYNNSTQTPAGNYYVVGDCNDSNAPGYMRMALGSYAFEAAQVWMEIGGSAPTYTTFSSGAGGDFAMAPTVATDGGIQRVTWHVLEASGPITITAWSHSSSGTCTFSAEATVGF